MTAGTYVPTDEEIIEVYQDFSMSKYENRTDRDNAMATEIVVLRHQLREALEKLPSPLPRRDLP